MVVFFLVAPFNNDNLQIFRRVSEEVVYEASDNKRNRLILEQSINYVRSRWWTVLHSLQQPQCCTVTPKQLVLHSLWKAGSAAQPAFHGELWATRIAWMDFLIIFFADSVEKAMRRSISIIIMIIIIFTISIIIATPQREHWGENEDNDDDDDDDFSYNL